MAQYIEQIGGYIADNPNIVFERCDGKVVSYYEVHTVRHTGQVDGLIWLEMLLRLAEQLSLQYSAVGV